MASGRGRLGGGGGGFKMGLRGVESRSAGQ